MPQKARNRPLLLRDFTRDYCLLYAALEEQRRRFAASGTLSFMVLNDLIGDSTQIGLFRHLEDDARRLFRAQDENSAALMLDLAVSCAYHECIKLKEDAFLHRYCRDRLPTLRTRFNAAEQEDLETLVPLLFQSRESAEHGLERILRVLEECRAPLARCLRGQEAERPLARFFLEHEALARLAFGPVYPQLLESLYGPEAKRLTSDAVAAFLESGHPRRALEILDGGVPSPALEAELEALRENARAALRHTT